MKRSAATVGDYMTKSALTIGFEQPAMGARDLMRAHRIRHLPVLQEGKLVGVLSERNLAWAEALNDEARCVILVEEAMTPHPFIADPATPLRQVALAMAEGKYGATVIVHQDNVVGVFTTTDAMRALADALRRNGDAAAASA